MAIQSFSVGQVLTAAQVNALQANDYNQTVSNKTGSYTLVAADKGTRITMSSTSATTITVNTSLFSAGDTLFIQNLNTGVCTITSGTATVTTSASLALAQWEGGTLYFTSASAAIFIKGAGGAGGGMTLLSTTTLSGATTTVSSIDQTYKNLEIVIVNAYASGANNDFIRFNGDTGNNYGYRFNNSGSPDQGSGGISYLGAMGTTQGYYDGTYIYISIPRYAETEYKMANFTQTKGNNLYLGSNSWNNTAAITSFTIGVTNSQTMSGGTMYIYGVK